MKRFVLDRFAGQFAVLEDEEMNFINVPCAQIKGEAKEGDCLYFNGENYVVDIDGGIERKKRIQSKFERLKSRQS